jgi:hypothetical protein
VPPTNLPQRIAARLTGGTGNLLRRLDRRNPARTPHYSIPKLTLALALVGSSSIAAWCLLHTVEDSEDARPTVARSSTELELLPPQIGRRIDASHHERSRTGDPERDPSNDTVDPSPMPPHPTDRVLPPPTPSSPDARAVPKVMMLVRGVMGLDGAQVKVGAQTVTVGELGRVLVAAGRRPLRWRPHERDAWRSGGSWRFQPGTTVVAFVTTRGLELRTLP